MRKLGLLLLLFAFVGAMQAQNIVKSLERNVPGQGKVTIHQDPRIEALLGTEHTATGEQKVLKAFGFRVQTYAGNKSSSRNCLFTPLLILPAGYVVSEISVVLKKQTP